MVGQRVVVRRILEGQTGPTGGPAFSDVLGVCESWADGLAVLRRADGTTASIPVREIVSGKPVPPRPSIRHRVSARDAELHALPLWPDVERSELGEWQLRLDPAPRGRLLKRANSCLAMGEPGLPFEEAEARIRSFYAERDRRPLAQVEADSAVEAAFLPTGWEPLGTGDSRYLLAGTAQLRRSLPDPGEVTLQTDGPRTLAMIGDQAAGRAALDDDWLGVHAVEVAPEWRLQGLATRVMAALAEWGAEQGARTVWLHVETDNEPALAFYDRLGFAAHHDCRYLTPSAAGAGRGGGAR